VLGPTYRTRECKEYEEYDCWLSRPRSLGRLYAKRDHVGPADCTTAKPDLMNSHFRTRRSELPETTLISKIR
jgi:hypothetical protein